MPYSQTGMVMEDLEPATEYMIRLSSINKYGTSDGVLVTQNTREGTGILIFCAVYTNMRVVTFKTRMSIDTPHPLRNISRFFS